MDAGWAAVQQHRLPWCDTDLSTAHTVTAPLEQVAGQRLLHEWAAGTAEHTTACGLAITHRLGFQALVELLDSHLSVTQPGAGMNLLELTNDPAMVAAGLPAAVHVLAQPNLDAAAQALGARLSYDGPHAPLGPAERIVEHHYSPILAAVPATYSACPTTYLAARSPIEDMSSMGHG